MKSVKRRILSWILTVVMICAMLPMTALAAGDVARVGDTTYATLDAAVEAAPEGSTIVLLKDCELTKGFNKTLTFTGNSKISINKQLTSNGEGWMCFGLYDPSRVLTFDGVEVEWKSEVGTAPWLMLSLSGTLNVVNGAKLTFVVDSGATGSRNAVYLNKGAQINVENASTFEIFGYGTQGKEGQGIQLDSTGTAQINVTGGSTFLIDGTNRGYVNSPSIYVEDSTFTVKNCTANASNGGDFTAINSLITYKDNKGHGLSAGNVKIENSEFTADNNGYYGVYVSKAFNVDSKSVLTVTRNSSKGDFAGLKLTSGVTDGLVESGAKIRIEDNFCSGLSNNGKVKFEEGADLTIMNNNNEQGTSSYGGGIYNSGSNAVLVLPSDAKIYNNYAKTAGDDIYNNTTATITFGEVGSNWSLDKCEHKIDGWYQDTKDHRWNVSIGGKLCSDHSENEYYELYNGSKENATGLFALKAAHDNEAIEKASMPGLEKYIVIDGADKESITVASEDIVDFKLVSNVPDDLTNYLEAEEPASPSIAMHAYDHDKNGGIYTLTFHDQLDEEFVFDEDSIQLSIGDTVIPKVNPVTQEENYTISVPGEDEECTFEVSMNLVALYEAGYFKESDFGKAKVIVTYSAQAVSDIKAGTYHNTAWVEYEAGQSQKDIVDMDTYAINIFKYDQSMSTKGLAGAEFELKDESGKVIEKLTSGENGYVRIDGLNIGNYTLTETKAPEGYVMSDQPLNIEITVDGDADNIIEVRFVNSLIPHTGGSGTRMYTIAGAVIVLGAGALLVVSRRKKEDK